jgi:hypothetical protein
MAWILAIIAWSGVCQRPRRDATSKLRPKNPTAPWYVPVGTTALRGYGYPYLAEAENARVSVARDNGALTVEVRDDGVGGADPANGSGLRGLSDRVSALDGRLELESPCDRGTVVRARIPVGDSRAG